MTNRRLPTGKGWAVACLMPASTYPLRFERGLTCGSRPPATLADLAEWPWLPEDLRASAVGDAPMFGVLNREDVSYRSRVLATLHALKQ